MRRLRIVEIATFPPRRCGIATYTANLVEALARNRARPHCRVLAVSEAPSRHTYDRRVAGDIVQDRCRDYVEAARVLNEASVDVVNLQHEFGIFGGPDGQHVLSLVRELRKPLVVTLHTVLSQPTAGQRAVMEELLRRAQVAVVMARRAVDILRDVYGVPADRLRLIPHGVPDFPVWTREEARARLGLTGRKVISTLGLINPGKGIEYVLRALPAVVERHPDVLYLVLGQTHPGVRRVMGESYRDQLCQIVAELGIGEHVRFVDAYLTEGELMDYLAATDVYVTPYVGREQIVSGTLAYAVGAGKAIVSTPYVYAQELLGHGAGLLVPFRDSEALAGALLRIFEEPGLRHRLEERAAALGRLMTWNRVAARYLKLFLSLAAGAVRLPAAPPAVRILRADGGRG
ncbi:MAG: glycosyltransferase family 4 protein [Clostridia bacterium]|nr:glycosyltransferase family 4 protein [Clostridia bacterium]